MASETELTPTSYIDHHLTYLTAQVSEGSFWVLHVDTLVTSIILGIISFGFIWLVVRKATPGVPSKTQAFVELAEQVKAMTAYAKDYAITIAVMGCRVNGPGETDDADLGLWKPEQVDEHHQEDDEHRGPGGGRGGGGRGVGHRQ